MTGTFGAKAAILVVEDELLLRLNAVEMIEDAGFEPIEAENADTAMRILEARADIRLVFTDIRMPGSIDGLKLAHTVRDRWPAIKVTVTSGHVLISAAELPADCQFLRKPYGSAEIASMLEQVG
jgi:DNA-binding NtrC family response regulator